MQEMKRFIALMKGGLSAFAAISSTQKRGCTLQDQDEGLRLVGLYIAGRTSFAGDIIYPIKYVWLTSLTW
jgi:hypothetical protein